MLVHLAAQTNIPQTGLGFKPNAFLTVLEAGKSKTKALADLVTDENLLSGVWTVSPYYLQEGALRGLFH